MSEERLIYTITEAAKALCMSRATVYRLLKSGDLTSKRIRGRSYITRASIDHLLGEEAK